MVLDQKNIVATIYLKDGYALRNANPEAKEDAIALARLYNDSGVDKIIIYDLSTSVRGKDKNLKTIVEINRNIDVKTCGGGNIKRLDDVKKFLYAGCAEVIFNGGKLESIPILQEASERFGLNKMLVSICNMNFIFKARDIMEECVHEFVIYDKSMITSYEGLTEVPYILDVPEYSEEVIELLKADKIRGICGSFINDIDTDIMKIKCDLSDAGIKMDNFEPKLEWEALNTDENGLIPVCVQDYITNEVIMMGYMNEEAFNTTMRLGKMTYYSRSKKKVVTRGAVHGQAQYVKSLTADCYFDSILAKVSQVGECPESGMSTCFCNDIVKKETTKKTSVSVFESVYELISETKHNPSAENLAREMFDKGLDEILSSIVTGSAEIVLASKNDSEEDIKYAISDFLFNTMILMVEKGLTWEDITRELLQH